MSESVSIELPERLDIASAERIHMQLEQVLEQGCAIDLIGTAVQKIDTAGVQILTGFFAEAMNQHLVVNWQDVSDSITETFSFLNLTAAVGLDQQAGAKE